MMKIDFLFRVDEITSVTVACQSKKLAEHAFEWALEDKDEVEQAKLSAVIQIIDELLPRLQPQSIIEAGMLVEASLPYFEEHYGDVSEVLPEPLIEMLESVVEALQGNQISVDALRDLRAVLTVIEWTPFCGDASDLLLCNARRYLNHLSRSQVIRAA